MQGWACLGGAGFAGVHGGAVGLEIHGAGAEEGSGAKTGLIIGIVIGVIALLGPYTA